MKTNDIQLVSNDVMNMLHEEELELMNSFHAAVVAKDMTRVDELFEVVLFDIEDHFSTEEEMMEQSKFYAMQMHKSEHDTMRQKVKKLHEEWKAHKDLSAIKSFLEEEFKQWIALHIARWDSETAMHLGDSM